MQYFDDIDQPEQKVQPFSLSLDIKEVTSSFILRTVIPGLQKSDIKIDVKGQTLTISGEIVKETDEKDEIYHLQERSYGKFTRSIPFPENADLKNFTVDYTAGVLKVTIPKQK